MNTETAIQEDVEVKQPLNERDSRLSDIVKRAQEERDQELAENGHEVVDTKNVEVPESKEEPEEPEIQEEPEEPIEKVEEPKPVKTVKIKVDGEEKEVPEDKILDAGIRTLQKESSADKRLEEATRLLREIEQKYAQPQEKKQENPSPEWDDKTVAYALEHGDEEQKAYAISLLRGRDIATPDEIERRATQKALDAIDFRDAVQWFSTEYSDIANDPYLGQLAALAEDRARASGDNRPRRELYKSIGDDLRKWKGGTTAVSTEKKAEQKSKITNLQSASVKKTAPEQPKAKTPSDVIEEMRRARGQA